MATVVTFAAPRAVELTTRDDAPLGPGEVRVQTLYSGISAGTELTAYRGSNPYLHKRWDGERRLFVEGEASSLASPVEGWGYEETGRIVEVGAEVASLQPGELVWGTWGHRSDAVIP